MTQVPLVADGVAGARARVARVRGWLAAHATTVPFRLAVALGLLGLQLALAVHSGQRFNVKFNAAPGRPPRFQNPASDWAPNNWDRLIVSRWDSGNYIELGLRGYQYCPPRGPTLPVHAAGCNLAFYPTYGLAGRYVGKVTGLPIDFALWGISLLSSFLFLFLWTGKDLTSRLGVAETYLALLFFNAYTTGYCLVMVQTEPLTLVLALGAFVAFARGHRSSGCAPGRGGERRSHHRRGDRAGVRGGAADRALARAPALRLALGARRFFSAVVSVWGQLALMAYHAHRFGDPMTYVHAHGQLFHHEKPSLGALFPPDADKIVQSIDFPLHEGLWLAAALLWFVHGHREALRRFPVEQQAFWYVTYLATVGIATVGMMPISLAGMSRYLLLALPMFFAMAAAMRPRPLLALLWVAMTAWHYWNVDLCTYTGGMGDHALAVCHTAHWIRH